MPRPPDWLVRRLRTLPGVRVEVDAMGDHLVVHGRGATPIVFRAIPVRGGWGKDASRRAKDLSAQAEDAHALLVVRRLPATLRDELAEAGVSWAEQLTGHLHLQAAPLFVHVEAERRPTAARAPTTPGMRPTRLVA
ncbi:MAG: hypothetical protein MUF00_20765, partial [Gemmatimonadaceae bacterium]|nr:hypothetical protein [Gemmatimonadaceae bacterium]